MRKTRMRINSLLLAILMALSLLPITAWANGIENCPNDSSCTHAAAITANGTTTHYDSLQEAVDAATENTQTTIQLLKNVAENITIKSGQNIVLDLDGHSLSNSKGVHTISNSSGILEIKDGIVHQNTSNKYAIYSYQGTTVIQNVTVENSGTYMMYVSNGTLTIKSGTFTHSGNNSMVYLSGTSAKVTIEGGTFTNQGSAQMLSRRNGSYTISGGTFNGGNAEIVSNDTNFVITGGQFSKPVFAASCVEGYMPTSTATDGYYSVKEMTAEDAPVLLEYTDGAEQKTEYYADPAVALNAAKDKTSAVVTVVKDVTTGSLSPYGKAKLVIQEDATLHCSTITVSANNHSGVSIENSGTIIATSSISGTLGSCTLVNRGTIQCKILKASSGSADTV